ncbi:MAG: cation:proton antiporter [Campylobacterales bacterium]
MSELVLIAVLSLGIAVTVNIFFKKFELPLIIGYIFSGTVIVYIFNLHEAANSKSLLEFAELGIVFLMFMIGLEFSAKKIKSMRKEVVLYGLSQVLLSAGVFFVLSKFVFALDTKISVVIALAFALSSTAIVLKTFNETKEIYTPYGKNALGILIFQDIAVIPIMLTVSILANTGQDLSSMLTHTLFSAIFVLFLFFFVGRYVIAKLLQHSAESNMDEIFVGALLFILIGFSALAHYFGFSYSLGAFIAGMIIAETKYKHKAEADLAHFRDILLGFFFVTVGFHIDIVFLLDNIYPILGVLCLVVLVKLFVIFAFLIFFEKREIALKSAFSLAQVGEFSFAIFYIAKSEELLGDDLYKFLLLVVVLSMILTPFMLKYMGKISSYLITHDKKALATPQYEEMLNDHVIVCGYGDLGREIVDFLKKFDVAYITVDERLAEVEEGLRRGDNIFLGSLTKSTTLSKLRAEYAVAVVVALDDMHLGRVMCEKLLDINPQLHIIVRTTDDKESEFYNELPIYKIVNGKKEMGKKLAQAAISCEFRRLS